MENKTVLRSFLDYIDIEKGLSKNTRQGYERDLRLFFVFLKEKNYEQISEEDLLRYIEYMREKYSKDSVLRKISTIRGFYDFLFKDSIVEKVPTENLEGIKRHKYIPEILTIGEIKEIIMAIDNSACGKRDRIITKLLFATGGRISEIIALKMEDIDFGLKYIKIRGKGSKSRIVPIYPELSLEIKDYIENVRPNFLKKEEGLSFMLFPKISRQVFWRRLKMYAQNCGITKNVYPHIFRHSVATMFLENGADLRVVQEILGHSSIATTEMYTHLNKKTLKNLYDKIKIGDD